MSKVRIKEKQENAGKQMMGQSVHSIDNIVSDGEAKVKKERVLIGVKMDKHLADRIKSRAMEKNRPVSVLLELALEELFKDVVVNEELLEEYNKANAKNKNNK